MPLYEEKIILNAEGEEIPVKFPIYASSTNDENIYYQILLKAIHESQGIVTYDNCHWNPFTTTNNIVTNTGTLTGGFLRNNEQLTTWDAAGNLPSTWTEKAASCNYKEYAYIVGGDSNNGRYTSIFRKLTSELENSAIAWETCGSTIGYQTGALIDEEDGYIYLIGGTSNTGTIWSNIYRKSLDDLENGINSWTTHGTPPPATQLFYLCPFQINDHVYTIGGNTLNIYRQSMENLRNGTSNWSTHGTLNNVSGLTHSTILDINDEYIYIIGGYIAGGKVFRNSKTNIENATGTWAEIGLTPRITATNNDRYISAVKGNDKVYLLGGNCGNTRYTQPYFKSFNTFKGNAGVPYTATFTLNTYIPNTNKTKIVFWIENVENLSEQINDTSNLRIAFTQNNHSSYSNDLTFNKSITPFINDIYTYTCEIDTNTTNNIGFKIQSFDNTPEGTPKFRIHTLALFSI